MAEAALDGEEAAAVTAVAVEKAMDVAVAGTSSETVVHLQSKKAKKLTLRSNQ